MDPKVARSVTALEPFHRKVMVQGAIILSLLILGVAPLLATGISSQHIYTDLPPWTCLPNGRIRYAWEAENYSWEVWKTDSFLSITLGFGRLSFGAAKWVDVLWDTLIGHGGQALLAYLAYIVFTKAMLFSMEGGPVSFDLYTGIAFKTFSAETLWTLTKENVMSVGRSKEKRDRGLPNAWVFAALALAGVYILAFPVMLSAMTGYQVVSTSYVARPDTKDLVDMTSLDSMQWILLDGSRVGLINDFPVPENSFYETQLTAYIDVTLAIPGTLANHTANDPRGFNRSRSSNVTVGATTFYLGPPLLTIVAVELDLPHYTAENVTYNSTWIESHAVCSPSDQYRWGFSFLLLFVFCVVTAVFVALLCAVWWTIYWHSRTDRTKQGFNMYSAIMDLASNVAADLGDEGADLTAEDLKQAVRRHGCSVKMDSKGLPMSRHEEERAIRQGQVDAKLLPGNRGVVGYFFTQQDVDRARLVLPRWRKRALNSAKKKKDDWLEMAPVSEGSYARLSDAASDDGRRVENRAVAVVVEDCSERAVHGNDDTDPDPDLLNRDDETLLGVEASSDEESQSCLDPDANDEQADVHNVDRTMQREDSSLVTKARPSYIREATPL